MPTVKLTLEQISHILQELTPGEIETLQIMFDPELKQELKQRWQTAKKEFVEGKTITKEELFKDD